MAETKEPTLPLARVLRSLVTWPVLTMFILITLKTVMENSRPVVAAENWTYEQLQRRISRGRPTPRQDVLVVDLGKIQPEVWERNGRTGTATPREPLKKLIEAFTDLGARAIGIDVDFSPENGELIHPDDNEFFQWCLDRSKATHIPILLGVFRTGLLPEEWLGDDRYMRLAAYIGVKEPDRAVYWVSGENGFPLRGMGSALAGLRWESFGQQKSRSWSWLVEPTSIIDYHPLTRIREDVFHAIDPQFYRDEADKIKGRTIVIGDTYREQHRATTEPEQADWFHPTGLDEQIPGVFVHACAAATIAASKPIYELTLLGRILIDVALAVIVLLLVKASLWLRLKSRFDTARAEHLFDLIYTVIAIIVVFLVGFVLVRVTRLLWTDFILVCLVLLAQFFLNLVKPAGKKATPAKTPEPDKPSMNTRSTPAVASLISALLFLPFTLIAQQPSEKPKEDKLGGRPRIDRSEAKESSDKLGGRPRIETDSYSRSMPILESATRMRPPAAATLAPKNPYAAASPTPAETPALPPTESRIRAHVDSPKPSTSTEPTQHRPSADTRTTTSKEVQDSSSRESAPKKEASHSKESPSPSASPSPK